MSHILYLDIYQAKRRTNCILGEIFLFLIPNLIEDICGETRKINTCKISMDFEKKRARLTKNLIHSIWTPNGYGSSLDKYFTVDGHITGFKTNDFHNFLKVLYIII
jgi:hypothetical protein